MYHQSHEYEREADSLPMCFVPGQLHQFFVREALTINLNIVPRPTSGDNVNAVVHRITDKAIKQMVVRAMNKHSGQANRKTKSSKPPKKCYLCDANHLIRKCPQLPDARHRLPPDVSMVVHALIFNHVCRVH